MTQLECATGLKYLGVAYNKEFDADECKVYYDFLKEYNYDIFKNAIKKLIKKSKFIPKISEIVEECDKAEDGSKLDVIEYMNDKGYFKAPREYEKAIQWAKRNCVPEWFLADMRKYYMQMITETKQLEGNFQNQLKMSNSLLTG